MNRCFRTLGDSFFPLPAVVLLSLVCVISVFAHAKLETSEPKAGDILAAPPAQIRLIFSVAIQPSMSSIRVTGATGGNIDLEVTGSDDNKVLSGPIGNLEPGKYRVEWRALSADDHPIKGDFSFEVAGAAVKKEIADAQPTVEVDHSQMDHSAHEQPESVNWMQSVIRWLMYASMLALAGGFAFRQLVVKRSLAELGSETASDSSAAALEAHDRRLRTVLLASVILLIIAGTGSLLFQSAAIFETGLAESIAPSQLQRVITETSFGSPWLLQMSFAVAVLIIVIVLGAGGGSGLWWVGLAASAVVLASPSLTGHARAAYTDYSFSILSGWLHLIAAAIWVGGLFQIAVSVPALLRSLGGTSRVLALSAIIANFNKLAMAATALIVITGFYNSWIHVESFAALFGTAYGFTLLAKVGVSLLMVAFGGLNAFVLHPKIKAWTAEVAADGEVSPAEAARLQQSVRIEIALAAIVLFLAAILAFLPPAREHSVQMQAQVRDVTTPVSR